MKQLKIELENCYGIKKMQFQFDFSSGRAYAIYAPNGSMKSSRGGSAVGGYTDGRRWPK
jgi:hypothetical protein